MYQRNGFTLIEFLIVIALIGVVASFGSVRFVGAQKGGRDTRRMSDIKQYQNALEIYASKNNGTYPPIAASLITELCTGAYIEAAACPTDPNTTLSADDYWYAPDDPVAPGAYVLWASLEKTNDYFVVCSNGQVGTLDRSVSVPPFTPCPL